MKILFYCQHVLGIGHFFRTLELCRALSAHEVILVLGGPRVEAPLPGHVRCVRLPPLEMDAAFTEVRPSSDGESLERVRRERARRLMDLFRRERPGLFLVELYPFGRKAFRFELDPVLEALHRRELPPAAVVCSLRDILVEKNRQEAYEARVVDTLNRRFHGVAVHADPKVVSLEETFSRTADIRPPIVYTGFVSPRPSAGARRRVRAALGLGEEDPLLVVSAGGGRVGGPLVTAAAAAGRHLADDDRWHVQVLTGPYFPGTEAAAVSALAGGRLRVQRFSPGFLDLLAAADLSVSMAGYNTCMNLLAANVRALVWPFAENREQRMRAERLRDLGALDILEDEDLEPRRLAERMRRALSSPPPPTGPVRLDGAAATAAWLAERFGP
jgi:predicted glycosyltransferase